MAFLHVSRAFELDPSDGDLWPRYDTINIREATALDSTDYRRPFWCRHVLALDVILVGNITGDDGIRDFWGIVLDYSDDRSLVADADFVVAHPEYITPQLARKITTLNDSELDIMGLDGSIRSKIAQRYYEIEPIPAEIDTPD